MRGAIILFAVLVVWRDNSYNERAFEVERSADGVRFERIATVPRNATSYRDETGTEAHVYRVRAVNSSGASQYSNVGRGEVRAPAPMPIPAPLPAAPAATPRNRGGSA